MKDNMMTFSVTSNAGQYGGNMRMSIEINQDSTIDQMLEVFERMALALTYSPGSLKRAYENRLEEINDTLRTLAAQVEPEPGYDEDVLEEDNPFQEDYAEWVHNVTRTQRDDAGREFGAKNWGKY